MLWYRAFAIHSQNEVLVKNSFLCPSMYSCGYRSKNRADTNWSKIPMTSGGRTVNTTLYNDNVHDSYAIWPEKLLKNEYCKNSNRDQLSILVARIFKEFTQN